MDRMLNMDLFVKCMNNTVKNINIFFITFILIIKIINSIV